MALNFLSLNPDYWDGPRHNRHYFCQELSKHAPVLFASPPFNVARVIQNVGKWTLPASGTREISPNLIAHAPSKLLFTNHRFPVVNEWMRRQRLATLQRVMARHGFEAPVLLLWHPQYRELIGEFRERLVVYYVYDQYTGYAGGTGEQSAEEIEAFRKADVVFVLSRQLYDHKKAHAANVVHLANAVDFDLFSRSREPGTVVPSDLASIPAPRIGYIGTINEKVNVPVLERMADRHPEWSIVLVGRQNYTDAVERARFFELAKRPSVHWLPYKPYDQIPAYIKGLDVCLMCYVINGWTFYGDPSKLHEYLASGKPTIGAGLSSIREFSDVVRVADTPDEWVQAVEEGLAEAPTDPQRQRRIDTARANSYAARIGVFLDVVTQALR
jgi:glycosyltransferase involved in cell wall biosynthesis